ncbi:MAG: quinolinate synthase NadA [Melioribacteraceae bacterium]|nr:quinolinate synthase NadA [Melioribacteraceae bacterium]
MTNQEMIDEINKLKKEKNAVILAHNYELPEIQDLADFVGDSLGLSQQAAKVDADVILFCGVHFMAETASIISPNKKVLIPDLDAGCSLADSITADELRKWKSENPGAVVVSYVNTTAEVKAETDYCCTSSNAVKIVESTPKDKTILFGPDQFLGRYVAAITGRDIKIWKGSCHVHEKIGEIDFDKKLEENPNADFLIHPECGCSTSCMLKSSLYDCNIKIYSTEGMINHVKNSETNEFVIATEVGILHRLKKLRPDGKFTPMSEDSICEYMKMITLDKVLSAFKYDQHIVKVPEALAEKARIPIERMLEVV